MHDLYAYRFTSLHIEPSTYCNLECAHCLRTLNQYVSKNKNMDWGLYRRIVDSIKHKVDLLLCGIGEPTLNPHLQDMVEYAHLSNTFDSIRVTSNLTIKDPLYYLSLFQKGLTGIIVSIDSLNPATVNQMRKGTDIDRLKGTLRQLASMYPERISVNTAVNRINLPDIEAIADLLIELKIQHWEILNEVGLKENQEGLVEFDTRPDHQLSVNDRLNVARALHAKYEFAINKLNTFALYKHPVIKTRCNFIWDLLTVNCLGEVVPCCYYLSGKAGSFGNVASRDIYDIYNSYAFESFRNGMYENKPALCSGCHMY